MKVKQLVVNGYMIDCAGWFDFDEESRQTTVKIDWGNSESDSITDYLHGIFKHNANQKTGEVIPGGVNIVAHCDGVVFVHQPYEMISGANGNAREFIFKDGFVEAMKEDKPKRTKVEYVKVEVSINEIAKLMIDGEVFYSKNGGDKFDWRLNAFGKNNIALSELNGFDFHRRIETEIDERQEFIEAMSAILPEFDKRTIPLWIGRLYDSGKFKLVEK